ncbi:MAG: hypothetical protein P8X57_01905, partial [Cyclobacteriaceae bacterium]
QRHLSQEPVEAHASLSSSGSLFTYRLVYAEGWELNLTFDSAFPYRIREWRETYDGNVTVARRMKTYKLPYWQLNHNDDLIWRDSLYLRSYE